MRYIRTKDGIYDTSEMKWCQCSKQASYYKDKNYMLYVPLKQADNIEDLIQPGDIIFYFDFHSQKEQCMYLNYYIIGIKDINITKLLIPVEDDYRCVAKAEHEYHQFDNMKHVIKKGELKLL